MEDLQIVQIVLVLFKWAALPVNIQMVSFVRVE